jgi:hypothetical protein
MSRTIHGRVAPTTPQERLEKREAEARALAERHRGTFVGRMHLREAERLAQSLATARGTAVKVEPTRHILDPVDNTDYGWRKTSDGVQYVPITR